MYRNFSNEPDPAAAMRAHYAELRARTMGAPKPVVIPAAPPSRGPAIVAAPPPRIEKPHKPVRVYDWPRPLVRDVLHIQSATRALPDEPRIVIKRTPAMEIIESVAREHGVSVEEVFGKRRNAPVVVARQTAMAAVYVHRPDLSLVQIGRLFGRDHTTTLYAIRKLGVWRGGRDARKA
jgi:hypothetical protein